MRVLSWNLFHGRSVPPAGRALLQEFAERLASWRWEVALLQEVPPWWPAQLAAATDSDQRSARTSRNAGLALRRALAERRPDLAKSNGGGCNAILSRLPIADHRAVRLRSWPERRVAQLCRLADGITVVNYHGSSRVPLAEQELERLWSEAERWARGARLVLGGDLNLRLPRAPRSEIELVASRDVDHLFVERLTAAGAAAVLDRRARVGGRAVELSDHPPLLVSLRPRD